MISALVLRVALLARNQHSFLCFWQMMVVEKIVDAYGCNKDLAFGTKEYLGKTFLWCIFEDAPTKKVILVRASFS